MKKFVLASLALALAATLASPVPIRALDAPFRTNYSNDPYSAQIAMDAFGYSVRKRLESVRAGETARGGGYVQAPLIRSDDAYGMAPTTRTSTYGGTYSTGRRQLDCVYYNGFTVWGDLSQTWASQSSRGGDAGYKYRGTAPVVGFDWSSEAITVGISTSYNWGKLKSRSIDHDQKVRTWGVEGYFQYNTPRFYANATLGYGYNRYKGDRVADIGGVDYGASSKYHSNSFNIDAEFGYKLNFSNFRVTPHIGLRYFHDRRNAVSESPGGGDYSVDAGRKNYHVMELPIGVNLAYELIAGGAVIIPQVKFAWVPELYRKRGHANGNFYRPGGEDWFNEDAPRRSRHGFIVGAGLEAKITKSISAHLDYNCNFRSKAYEHHWNLGMGFTF